MTTREEHGHRRRRSHAPLLEKISVHKVEDENVQRKETEKRESFQNKISKSSPNAYCEKTIWSKLFGDRVTTRPRKSSIKIVVTPPPQQGEMTTLKTTSIEEERKALKKNLKRQHRTPNIKYR